MPVVFWINTVSTELCGSNFVDHSKLNTQPDWGDLSDRLVGKISSLVNKQEIHTNSENYEGNG